MQCFHGEGNDVRSRRRCVEAQQTPRHAEKAIARSEAGLGETQSSSPPPADLEAVVAFRQDLLLPARFGTSEEAPLVRATELVRDCREDIMPLCAHVMA